MSAEIISIDNGLVTLRISGTLKQSEMVPIQKRLEELINHEDKVRILVLAEDFDGWDRESDWGDVSFLERSDPHMEKMAIVGEPEWEDQVLMFSGKGMRQCQVEFFTPATSHKARAWLSEGPAA